MLILSQDKNTFINFSNITSISIDEYRNTSYKYNIRAYLINKNSLILGSYSEREKAKCILNEIIEKYVEYETGIYGNRNQLFEDSFIFRMPVDNDSDDDDYTYSSSDVL